MNIIEFTGDPMLQLENLDDMSKCIVYLNQSAIDEIRSYSTEVTGEDIPQFFGGKKSSAVLFAESGTDEEGKEFPDTYIGIKNTQNKDYPYCFSAIYAPDFQYEMPEQGEEIFLKRSNKQRTRN